ncbi:tyrosine-type recombinase/integrase [Tsukamurella sputi]|uniref:tyrosine-type recombinase/integrase n=1 Tax=Tsukamurella sputi TaxID=2591848 RepID=UPI0013156248|nr:site-specific integrase [Tsukamurella sputi]
MRNAAEAWLATIPSHQHRAQSAGRMRLHVLPQLGDLQLDDLTRERCDEWYAQLCPERPTQRARTYAALRAALRLAHDRGHLTEVPLKIRGAGDTPPVREARTATAEQLTQLLDVLPPQDRAAALLAAWCGLRVGEVIGLQRRDVEVDPTAYPPLAPNLRLRIRRHVVQHHGRALDEPAQLIVSGSKADKSAAAVVVPPHLSRALWKHLENYVEADPSAWLFPQRNDPSHPINTGTLHRSWRRARDAAGLDGFVFHDLRRTGNTLAAESGATLAEMMQRLRHRNVRVAQRYLVAAAGADVRLAERMSAKVAAPLATKPDTPPLPAVDLVEAEVERRLAARLRALGIEPE